ncbi:MAG: hypothetical protein J5493_03995, partial [Lachnospiraceae bacterium]|nr:hypothetical protein [Lachnospiraceae bacterium]
MRKKALLAVMMAMVLLLSSCALVVKDEAVDNAQEIIRMGDQVITKKEVKAKTEEELYNTYTMYYMYGYSYDVTDPENIARAQESAVSALKEDLALTAKAKELNLTLTDEELEEVKTTAQSSLDSIIESAKNYVEGADEMDEAALAEAAKKMAEKAGYTLEGYIESGTKSKLDSKLREYAVKDVAVTDEEIQAEYDSKVEADKTSYEGKAGSWASAANNGSTLYYTPAGVRRVKQILTKFRDEDQAAINEANQKVTDANTAMTAAQAKIDAAEKTLEDLEGDTNTDTDEVKAAKDQAQADLDAAQKELDEADAALLSANSELTAARDKAFANLDEEVDAILASLDAEGADWQAIMDEKNQDPGMKNNEKGYAVAADMTGFDSAFVEAAMALEKPGDHSGKVKGTSYGYYIIRYESDEAEGPVALDAVKEKISSSLLSTKQSEAWNAA